MIIVMTRHEPANRAVPAARRPPEPLTYQALTTRANHQDSVRGVTESDRFPSYQPWQVLVNASFRIAERFVDPYPPTRTLHDGGMP
jgi:hypothetical protein